MFTKVGSVLTLLLLYGRVEGRDESAIIREKVVSALLGHPINISCFAKDDRSLQSCNFERLSKLNDNHYIVSIDRGSSNSTIHVQDESRCNCSYGYYGRGLENGDCTLSILNVTDFHIAEWRCVLVDVDRKDRWVGNLRISSAEPVNKPYFKEPLLFQETVYNASKPTSNDVVCCFAGPDPSVPLSLSITLANTKNVPYDSIRKEESRHLHLQGSQACRNATFTFLPEDNGKHIVCNATYVSHSQKHESITALPIRVKYSPILVSNRTYQELISADDRLLIGFSLMSNPRPNVTWNVYTDNENEASFQISDHHIKYRPELHQIGESRYTANLTILNFQPEDYKRVFKVVVSNEIGSKNLRVVIISPGPGEETNAFWTMVILGIGAVLLLVLIALVIYIVIQNSRDKRRRGTYNVGEKKKVASIPKPRQTNKRNNVGDKKTNEETEPVELESSV